MGGKWAHRTARGTQPFNIIWHSLRRPRPGDGTTDCQEPAWESGTLLGTEEELSCLEINCWSSIYCDNSLCEIQGKAKPKRLIQL